MKRAGIIVLFCVCAIVAQGQDIVAILHVADSLSAQPDKVLEIINHTLAEYPDSEELLKVRANAYENLKQYDKAVDDYTRLIQKDPDDEVLWYALGRNQYMNGQLTDAMKSLHRATSLNSRYLSAFYTKIRILLDLHQYDAASKVSDSTLNIGATAMSYFLQGEVNSKLKLWQKAEWAYQGATKIDKGFIEAYIALANNAAILNKATETLEAAEAALGIDPDSKEALIAHSRGFALSKNYDYAIDDVSEVIRMDPNNVDAHFWRGIYYRDTNKPLEAIRDFEQVLKFQPDNWQAIAERADAYAKTGDKETALDGYRKLLDIATNYPEKDAITQFANRQIFELNRENRAPTLALIDPKPESFDISVPNNLSSITIKGKITDESPIQSLTVNGQKVPVTPAGNDFEFSAVVQLANVQEIQMEVSDVYNNMTKITYQLHLTETGKPQITLYTPKPSENGIISLSENATTLYIEGKVTDESAIVSILVDGKAVDFDHEASNPGFTAIIDISNKTRFSITATDRFGNTTEQIYILQKLSTVVTPSVSPTDAPDGVEQSSQ